MSKGKVAAIILAVIVVAVVSLPMIRIPNEGQVALRVMILFQQSAPLPLSGSITMKGTSYEQLSPSSPSVFLTKAYFPLYATMIYNIMGTVVEVRMDAQCNSDYQVKFQYASGVRSENLCVQAAMWPGSVWFGEGGQNVILFAIMVATPPPS